MRPALASLGLFAAAVCASLTAPAAAQDVKPAHADPLEPLAAAMKTQDDLVEAGRGDKAVAEARERAKDATPDGLYMLGRALGNVAVKRADDQRREKMRTKRPSPDEPPPELVFDADAQKLLDEARDCFERASEAGSLVYAPSHLGLGRVARVKGEFDASIEELKQALRISPNFKDAAIELAQAYVQKRLPSEAEFALHAFLAERPSDAEARVLLGVLMIQRNRFAEAEPEFRAVLSADATNFSARKLLAAVLMYQEKFEESAEHWEMVRRADPKQDEAYVTLFHIYRKLKKKDEAVGILHDLSRNLPGTEAARRADSILKQLEENPSAWAPPEGLDERETLVQRLESSDPAVVQKALEDMRALKWPALPAKVYQLLLKDRGTAAQRLASVRLIGDLADPRTLTILEIMLLHPAEREPDAAVRKEVAWAISVLPTDAIVPILFVALGDSDVDVRESAVKGLERRTGKSFRVAASGCWEGCPPLPSPTVAAYLLTRTTPMPDPWPAEYERYVRWWTSTSSTVAKREAMTTLAAIYEPVAHDSKMRIAGYALPAMDDPVEATWRAGYDLFRAMTYHSFGAETGHVEADERKRISAEARTWLAEQLAKAK